MLAAAIEQIPAVVTGVCDSSTVASELTNACDVLVSERHHDTLPTVAPDDGDAANLEALIGSLTSAVARAPMASVALVQLLRLSHEASIPQALAAESFAYATLQSGPEFRRWLSMQRQSDNPQTPEAGRSVVASQRVDNRLSIVLTDSARHNAFGVAMRDQLVPLLAAAAADPTITHVELRGAGPSFCAGGDLGEFGSAPDPASAHQIRMTRSAASHLHRISNKLTVFVHGAAIGAGVELSCFANALVASEDAIFRLPEVQMGLIPGAGGTVSITRRIGRQRCAWLAISNHAFNSTGALRWNLVDSLATDSLATDYPSSGDESANVQRDGG